MNPNTVNLTFKISLATLFVLVIANLIGSNLLATGGSELQSVNHEYQTLQKENSYLKNQIAQASSLNNLEVWAETHGYVKISNPLALTAPAPVAYVAQ